MNIRVGQALKNTNIIKELYNDRLSLRYETTPNYSINNGIITYSSSFTT